MSGRTYSISLFLFMAVFFMAARADASELKAAVPIAPGTMSAAGFTLMSVTTPSASVVEQMQTICRTRESDSMAALQNLVINLRSPHQLVRRKASTTLLEKVKTLTPDESHFLTEAVQSALDVADPVVQKNLARLLSALGTPGAHQALKGSALPAVRQHTEASETSSL